MNIFLKCYFKATYRSVFFLLLSALFIQSCGSIQTQFTGNSQNSFPLVAVDSSTVSHTFYLMGDVINYDNTSHNKKFSTAHNQLDQADQNTTLLFFDEDKKVLNTSVLNTQNDSSCLKYQSSNHKFATIYREKISRINLNQERTKKRSKLDTISLPITKCAIDALEINKDITLIVVNSNWYLENWDKNPTINRECTIKNREDFFLELENLLIKNQQKTVLIAMQHPVTINGSCSGVGSIKKQLNPLPTLATLIDFIGNITGINVHHLQNKQYNLFARKIKVLVHNFNNVIIVSRHDCNMQYIDKDNVKQITISSATKLQVAAAINNNAFFKDNSAYAKLKIHKSQLTTVAFYRIENGIDKLISQNIILKPKNNFDIKKLQSSFPNKTLATVYDAKEVKKSFFYKFLFGKHYREYYNVNIAAKTVIIDTLFSGLSPKPAHRDSQSNSLQLIDQKGKQYMMSAVKQNANKFLATVVFNYKQPPEDFAGTYTAKLLTDFYTAVHPYAPLAIADLANKIDVLHTKPSLFFIPKQKALGTFNSNFGDELYLIEEFPIDTHFKIDNLSSATAILSTKEVLQNMRTDNKYSIDESAYIRARLFDILIGDWDRNEDQWRWVEYNINKKVIYKPISLDHDQAFSNYDSALLSLLMKSVPLRNRQSFNEKITRVKLMNREAYPLDLALLKTAGKEEWIKQSKYIIENLSDEIIEKAFNKLPAEVQDGTLIELKRKLILRKKDLQKAALEYFTVLQHTVLIVGTNAKDKFVIRTLDKNRVEIKVFLINQGGDNLTYSTILNSATTKKIWIYGLDNEDVFEVVGSSNLPIKIRLIGGLDKDLYFVESAKNIKIHDFKSEVNVFKINKKSKIVLSDDYKTNLYDYKKPKYNAFSLYPNIGLNPDDGVKIGIITGYKVNDFKQDPYTQKHSLKANYFFSTTGYELFYDAQFPKIFGKWDLNFESTYTSPNFTRNYFGYGNETINLEADYGRDYNRVRIKTMKFSPSLQKVGRFGSKIEIQTSFEKLLIERTTNRFIVVDPTLNPSVFNMQQFVGATVKYNYENYDLPAFPTLGVGFLISAGWKTNLANTKRNFPTLESQLNFNHKIDSNGKIVIATIVSGKTVFNNNIELYQGATLGGDYDLRGFRNERFLGNQSFYQSSDIRWDLGKIKRNVIPMSFGILGGFDYGRIWLKGEKSEKWHQSYGGGFWINGLNRLTGRITYFKSINEDRAKIAIGLGFGF